jgi:hypothetical protein
MLIASWAGSVRPSTARRAASDAHQPQQQQRQLPASASLGHGTSSLNCCSSCRSGGSSASSTLAVAVRRGDHV